MLDSNLKFLADENIPLEVVSTLKKEGINIRSVIEICYGLKMRLFLN
jgi:hypothetical protein